MKCASCGGHELACEASLTVMRAGNEWDLAVYRCGDCAAYSYRESWDSLMSDDSGSFVREASAEGAKSMVAEFRRCPSPGSKACGCPVHAKYG